MTGEQLRYPLSTLAGDYLRAGGGMAICLALILSVDGTPAIVWVLLALTMFFGLFVGRTVLRQMSTVMVDDQGIRIEGPRPVALRWAALSAVRLRYYSLRSGTRQMWIWKEPDDMPNPRQNWLQLDLTGPDGTVKIDSQLPGFDGILDRVADCARSNDIAMNEVTRANMAAMGLMTLTAAVESTFATGRPAGRAIDTRSS